MQSSLPTLQPPNAKRNKARSSEFIVPRRLASWQSVVMAKLTRTVVSRDGAWRRPGPTSASSSSSCERQHPDNSAYVTLSDLLGALTCPSTPAFVHSQCFLALLPQEISRSAGGRILPHGIPTLYGWWF